MWRHNPMSFDYALNNNAIVHMPRELLSEKKNKNFWKEIRVQANISEKY